MAHTAKELVLQPQSELMEFRIFLWEQGYELIAENMVYEDGKYYPMMRVVYRGEKCGKPDRLALKYGEKLLAQKHPLLGQYLQWQKKQKEQILQQVVKNAKQDISGRIRELQQELVDIEKALNRMA